MQLVDGDRTERGDGIELDPGTGRLDRRRPCTVDDGRRDSDTGDILGNGDRADGSR